VGIKAEGKEVDGKMALQSETASLQHLQASLQGLQ
jgi:hypothetical protein